MKAITFTIICMLYANMSVAQELIPYRVGDKWGYSDAKGEIVLKPTYQEAGQFRAELTWVKKKEKYAYINKEGEKVTKFIFDEAGYFWFSTAHVKKDGKSLCINLDGEFADCVSSCGGARSVFTYFRSYKSNDNIGVILVYDICNPDTLTEVWSEVKSKSNLKLAAVKKGEFWGVINSKGELIVDYLYDNILIPHSTTYGQSNFLMIEKHGKYGFLNPEGEVVAPPKYHKLEFYEAGLAKAWINEDFWGYIDTKGKEFFRQK